MPHEGKQPKRRQDKGDAAASPAADTPTVADEALAVGRIVQTLLGYAADLLGGAEYSLDGAYRVRVTLGGDTVLLRRPRAGALTDLVGPAAQVVNAVVCSGDEQEIEAAVRQALGSGEVGLWGLVDALLTPCLCSWDLAEMRETYGEAPPVPRADMPREDRLRVYQGLPDRLVGSLVAALFWHDRQ